MVLGTKSVALCVAFICQALYVAECSLSTGPQPSLRANSVESFKVMDVLERAAELEHEGKHICHMEVGQPSTGAPSKVVAAAKSLLSGHILGYTSALGTCKNVLLR
jgi:hypothetical protein